MAILIAIPILIGLSMLQTSLVSQFPLLRGTADLLLLAVVAWSLQKRVTTALHWGVIAGLIVTYISALPFGVALIAYSLAAVIGSQLRRLVWQVPILAMFVATFAATVLLHAISYTAVRITGTSIPLGTVINIITLPSLLLNMFFALPAYALLSDLAGWLYPEELEV
ncbi:MAG: rod shape-determining protein MreD [Chloroflexi bacterium]|nr:rod shape-determining protein MreD [Chloroflexota bacterium]